MARRQLPPLSAEDRALWEALKQEVTPMHAHPVVTLSPKTEAAKAAKPKAPKSISSKPDSDALIWQAPGNFAKTLRQTRAALPSAPRDLRDTQAKGLDRASADRLRRGKMPIEGRLDLHGMTQVQAEAALSRFIINASNAGKRHLLVITGKGLSKGGEGVLRRMVPEWLGRGELARHVLAFSYAQKRDGEHGALYVLLRRS